MAQLTPEQFNKKLEAQIKKLQDGKIVFIAAKTSQQQAVERIFEKGLGSSGTPIGSYNTTSELWIGSPPAPRSTTRRGKTGKPIKTGYYKSYKAFRSQQGREESFVNLRLTNELQSDFANGRAGATSTANANPIKVTNFEYVVTLAKSVNREKREGIEKKYGKVFDLTRREEETFRSVLEKETLLILNA